MPFALRLREQTIAQVDIFVIRPHRQLQYITRGHEVGILVWEDDKQVFRSDARTWRLSREEDAATGRRVCVYIKIAVTLIMWVGSCT